MTATYSSVKRRLNRQKKAMSDQSLLPLSDCIRHPSSQVGTIGRAGSLRRTAAALVSTRKAFR